MYMTMSIEFAPIPIWFRRKFAGEPEELLAWSWSCPHSSSTMTQIFGESMCMSSGMTTPWCIVGDRDTGHVHLYDLLTVGSCDELIVLLVTSGLVRKLEKKLSGVAAFALYGTRSSWSCLASSCIADYIGCFIGWCPNNFHDIFYILFDHGIINAAYIYSNLLVGDSFLSGSYTRSRWRFNASALEHVLIYHRLGRRCWLVKVTGCYLSRDSWQGPRTKESFWSYLIELAPINVAW